MNGSKAKVRHYLRRQAQRASAIWALRRDKPDLLVCVINEVVSHLYYDLSADLRNPQHHKDTPTNLIREYHQLYLEFDKQLPTELRYHLGDRFQKVARRSLPPLYVEMAWGDSPESKVDSTQPELQLQPV